MREFIIKYWLQVVFSGALTAMGWYVNKVTGRFKKEMNDQMSIKLGVQAILRDRLIQTYNHHIRAGCCAIHDRDNIINMYTQYHNLGVNGVVDGLMKELLELPVQSPCGVPRGDIS